MLLVAVAQRWLFSKAPALETITSLLCRCLCLVLVVAFLLNLSVQFLNGDLSRQWLAVFLCQTSVSVLESQSLTLCSTPQLPRVLPTSLWPSLLQM